MASNSSKKPQQQSSLLSFFNKKPSENIIEKEVTIEQLAVKETASKPVKHHHQQAPLEKKPSNLNDQDSMDVGQKTQDDKNEEDDDDAPLVSKMVDLNQF